MMTSITFASCTNAALASICLFLLYQTGLIIYRLYFHPLAKFPGPKYLAISGFPQFYYQNVRGTFYKQVKDLQDQYGSIVRVAPNELAIDGSIGWKDIYGHKKTGEEEWEKDILFYKPADDGKGINGSGFQDVIVASRDDHRRQRRVLSHAFSDSALTEQEDLVQSYIDALMQRFKQHIAENKKLDMVKWFNSATFDIIGDLTFGESFQCLETGNLHPWVRLIFPQIKTAARLRLFGEYPILKPLIPFFLSKEAVGQFMESMAFTQGKIQTRLGLGKNTSRKDFMSYILRHNDEKGMHHQEIMGNTETLVIAGSETTATLLSGLTYYLSTHPAAWRRLTDEIRGAFSSEKDITMRATAALPYLHACLEEGLRIYPPAANTPPRFSPGAEVDGQYIAKGTKIWIQQWATHHQERNFLHADDFIPERWLQSTHPYYDPRFVDDNRASMQPFAFGPRNCLGKNLAYAEIRVVMARLAWNFEVELMPESRSWIEGQKVFTVFQKPPLMMKLYSRADRDEVK